MKSRLQLAMVVGPKRRRILEIVLLAALVTTQVASAQNPSTMVLAVPPRLLDAGTANNAGEIDMWEYVYDFYGNGVSQLPHMGIFGFDASLIVNRTGGDGNTLSHNWGYSAANDFYASPSTCGSISHDGLTWTVYEGGIDNIWHDPDEYGGFAVYVWAVPGFAMRDWGGAINDEDGTLTYRAKVTTGNALDGLLLTFRVVHPNSPGDIDWYSYSYNGGGTTASGTIQGPGSGSPPGDFDEDGDVDADDADILCANMGGAPDPYDLDEDGDVDEDDLVELIETLVEWDNGVDTGIGTYRGDFNLDGVVNATDLAIMKGTFGASGVGYAGGNANCDDVVNATDLAILKATFGFVAPTGGGVPEPVTIGLLSLGGLGLLRRRRS